MFYVGSSEQDSCFLMSDVLEHESLYEIKFVRIRLDYCESVIVSRRSKVVAFVAVKVGIPEFLNGIGKGVESHAAKLETEVGDFQKLLVTRTLRLKKLGIPCKQVFPKSLSTIYAHT